MSGLKDGLRVCITVGLWKGKRIMGQVLGRVPNEAEPGKVKILFACARCGGSKFIREELYERLLDTFGEVWCWRCVQDVKEKSRNKRVGRDQ